MERLTRLVARDAAKRPEEIVRMIDVVVESFANGAVQGDDMTLVVIRRK